MDAPRACGPPPPEAVYTDYDTAVAAIQGHAKGNGYALVKRDSRPRRVVFMCDRNGKVQTKKAPPVNESKRRPGSGTKKCGCTMKVALSHDDISGYWTLSTLEGTHNHESSADAVAHAIYRTAALDPKVLVRIRTLSAAGVAPAPILTTITQEFPDATLVKKDVSNIIQKIRLEVLGGRTPIQWLLDVRTLSITLLY